MAHKHLHELLQEDQEPFHLKAYIAARRFELKRSNLSQTTLQIKKRKPITEIPSSTKRSFCKQACFMSFHDSPDGRKTPFLDFPSPVRKSPIKSQNGTVLFHVPARTAALLLEAAMRIQKQQNSKSKSQIKNVGFGLFGSILKRLRDRNKSKNREIGNSKKNINEEVRISAYEKGLSCSCNNSRISSAGWSESNEEKSLDLESSSSCRSVDSLEEAFAEYERRFCSSPLNPFPFALRRSPSTGGRTPGFLSPAASPNRHNKEEQENNEAEGSNNIKAGDEEKERCSPSSVLDRPFEDDDDGHEDEDDHDLECSYAIVQRAKEQLLEKLRRFERLAELDPVELEKRMMEQMAGEEDSDEEERNGDDPLLMTEVGRYQLSRKVPADMNRLISDLIPQEKEVVVNSVWKKLISWKEVESNAIDMIFDFGREFDGWKKQQQQQQGEEIGMEIEHAVFNLLVEELVF